MTRYIIRRLLQGLLVLFLLSVALYFLMENVSDPLATMGGRTLTRSADRLRLSRQLGLDKPWWERYIYWLIGNDWAMTDPDGNGNADTPGTRMGILRGDWGRSIVEREPVTKVIADRIPNTLMLMIPAEVVIILGSLLIGVYSALRQYSLADNLVTAFSFIGYSMPIYFVALASLYIFAVNFKIWGLPYLPTSGMFDPQVGESTGQLFLHLILPVLTISLTSFAANSRYVRSTMLEAMNQDYIRTAKSKGLPRPQIVFIHALKNASLPLITVVGLDLPSLLGGAVVTEGIFAWPGTGRLFIDKLSRGDTPVIMGVMMMLAVAVVVFQILTDLAYAWLDPRIRYE